MIFPMEGSRARIIVWIDCPRCGRYQKLAREVVLPFQLAPPLFERTDAVCGRCWGIAVMCFERGVSRLN